jgi:diacylglycerol kinase family enzyme
MNPPSAEEPRAALPHLDAERVVILANPRAGSRGSRDEVQDLVKALGVRGLRPAVCWRREELPAYVDDGPRDDLRCVVAAGGDGTLAEVCNRSPGVPVAVLPLGNENLVAQYCRVERSAGRLAEAIAAGRCRRFDLASVNDRFFTLMAGAGLDAEVVRRVHADRRGHVNRLTYAWHVMQTIQDYNFPLVEVEVEGTGERLSGAMVFVFNLPQYALNLPIARDARPDDGLLDLYVFQRPGLVNLARYLEAVVRGAQHKLPDFQHRAVRGVRLWSEPRVALQTDGDPAGCLPVTIEVVPRALTLVVPTD